jgi:hypothetical protein
MGRGASSRERQIRAIDSPRRTYALGARDAWDALPAAGAIRIRRGEMLVAEGPGVRAPASLWTLVHVIAGAADLAAMDADPGSEQLLATLPRYRSGDAFGPTPRRRRRYFDDNAWLGLLSLRLFARSGDDRHLRRATELLRFVRTGEAPEGGVLWVEGSSSRNACSTAPSAELALALHLHRADDDAVAFARRSLAWLRHALGRDDGVVADRVENGVTEPTVWSYNQGAAFGGHRLLARAAADTAAAAASVARRTAESSLTVFDGDRLWREPPPFLAVWFRELLDADDTDLRRGARDRLGSYLDRALREARDPRTGLFTSGGIGSYDGRPTIDQAAFVQLLALGAGVDPVPSGAP